MLQTLRLVETIPIAGLQFSNLYFHRSRGFMMSILISDIFLFRCFAANIHVFTPGSYLGHRGGVDENSMHSGFASHSLVSDRDDTRAFTLTRPSQKDFRVLMTDGELHSSFMHPLKKPSFFF